jgi:hypothetical protein
MAVCYAMYKTLFKNGYPFSYDLDEISEYYLAYHKLMQHWRGLLGEQLYEVAYESIVADQNGSTRGILNYCNLRWEDACLQFHTSALPSTTASASQVRRPIYSSSVSQWRVYEEQLGGLRARLSAGGIAVD